MPPTDTATLLADCRTELKRAEGALQGVLDVIESPQARDIVRKIAAIVIRIDGHTRDPMSTDRDAARLDYMEANLKRAGAEMHFADGNRIRPRHAWAVASELDTLRETIDALMAHGPSAFARGDSNAN
jgi:hypothetical protein